MDDPADVPDSRDEVPNTITQAGQPNIGNGNLNTNTRWDGQVSKNRMGHLATIPVMVRWDSAAVIRHALAERNDPNAAEFSNAAASNFILTVVGLLPSRTVKAPATLKARSASDDGADQARNTEEILEWFMANSLILVKGEPSLRPQNVKVDSDSGTVHLFFTRTDSLLSKKRELQFVTRYGTMNVAARFHVKDMLVDGKPDL